MIQRGKSAALALLGLVLGLLPPGADAADRSACYRVVPGWPRLPAGSVLGQVAGVGADSRGNIIVFNRAENSFPRGLDDMPFIKSPPVIAFDGATGKIAFSWGAGLFKHPHGLRVDQNDNIWLTDDILQQVFKFSHDGKLLLALGTPNVVGCDESHFNGPTDVAVTPDGSFYVADGYGSSRIAKFAADGRFLFSWGHCSTTARENLLVFQQMRAAYGVAPLPGGGAQVRGPYDGPDTFNTPHSIVFHPRTRSIYVADRDNARIQVFDEKGNYLKTFKSAKLGRPWAIALGPDGLLYVVDGGDLSDGPTPSKHPFREAIMKIDLAGRVLQKWSGFGNQDGYIYWGHDIAVDAGGAVYVGDVGHGMRVQKFTPGRPACAMDRSGDRR